MNNLLRSNSVSHCFFLVDLKIKLLLLCLYHPIYVDNIIRIIKYVLNAIC